MNGQVARTGRMARAAHGLLIGALLACAGAALSKDKEQDHRFYSPEKAGPYGIGHTTVIVTDPSRNLDGT